MIHATRDELSPETFCQQRGFPGALLGPAQADLRRASTRCQECDEGYRAFFHHQLPLAHTNVER